MSKELALFGDKQDEMPQHLTEYSADVGVGNDNLTADDLAMPVLQVLQPTSEQIGSVDGAMPGALYNNVTQEAMNQVYAINLNYRKTFAVFRKRQAGGGFHGNYDTKTEADAHVATLPGTATDYDVIETANHFLLLLDAQGNPVSTALLRLKSTGLAISRQWNAELQVKNQNAARFATVWLLTSEKRSNDKGTWYVLKPSFAGWAPENLYLEARKAFSATSQVELEEVA